MQPFDYPLKFAVLAGTSKLHAHVALYVALCQINILQSGIRAIQGRRTTRNDCNSPQLAVGSYIFPSPSPACDPIQHVSCTLDLAESPLLSFHIYLFYDTGTSLPVRSHHVSLSLFVSRGAPEGRTSSKVARNPLAQKWRKVLRHFS